MLLVWYILQVTHLEPWEKNSRKTAGQIGMCAGVGAIVLINAYSFNQACLPPTQALIELWSNIPRLTVSKQGNCISPSHKIRLKPCLLCFTIVIVVVIMSLVAASLFALS